MENIQSQLMAVVPVSTACKFLKLKYHIHLQYEKSIIIERTIIQYVKDRTESFDDYLFSLK